METGRTVEVVGPPWMMIIIAGISLLGVVVTAVIGPIVVERFKSGRTTPESPEFSMITQWVSDAVMLVQSAMVVSVITSLLVGGRWH